MSSIKIPLALRGQYIQRGIYAIFTSSDDVANKIANRLQKKDTVRRTGCGKEKIGASPSVFWCFYSCLNDPDLYA